MYRDVVGQAGFAAPGDRGSRGPQVIAWPELDDADVVVFAAPDCFESVLVIYSLALRSLVLISRFAEQKPYPRNVAPDDITAPASQRYRTPGKLTIYFLKCRGSKIRQGRGGGNSGGTGCPMPVRLSA